VKVLVRNAKAKALIIMEILKNVQNVIMNGPKQ